MVSLVDALQQLSSVLLPHLQREEDDAMPVVSITITASEWQAVDHEYFIEGKSLAQLGFEGHWVVDDRFRSTIPHPRGEVVGDRAVRRAQHAREGELLRAPIAHRTADPEMSQNAGSAT